jgi:hypothetical protein
MTPFATVATVGAQRCRKADVGRAALRTAQFACLIFMVMAAGFACRSITRMREALAPPCDVARVQAAAEGEVNHHRERRDAADKRSHGPCPFPSDYRPQFLSNSRSIARGLRSIARAGLLPVGPSFQFFQRPRSRNWSVRPSARPACALGFCRSGRPFSANQPSVTETIAVPVDDAWPS